MTIIDIRSWEMQNVVRDGTELRTRRGLVSTKTPTASNVFVGGFSIESPSTTEVWHYLFEQAQSVVTLRVFTEEFLELFSFPLGPMQKNPIITYSVTNAQVMINSPSFSVPLYGLLGGGVINAIKVASIIEDFTALDISPGHVCSFGDRPAIAAGAVLSFGDGGVDPRTFVAENLVAIPGSVFDLFQAGDGALQLFTSDGVYTMPADSIGQGQTVSGFISKVPGIQTSKARNAAFSNGVTAVLQRDSIVTIGGEKIYVMGAKARRFFSKVIEVSDLRQVGEIFSTPRGFLVGFRGSRGFYIEIDIEKKSVSFVTNSTSALNVVGVLKSRDGETLPIFTDRVVMPIGNADFSGGGTSLGVDGVLSGRIPLPESTAPVVRRVTTSAANAGQAASVYINGANSATTTPTQSADTVIGTATWSNSIKLAGRSTRTVRHSFATRTTDPSLEVAIGGGDRRIEGDIDVEFEGQDKGRRDRE